MHYSSWLVIMIVAVVVMGILFATGLSKYLFLEMPLVAIFLWANHRRRRSLDER